MNWSLACVMALGLAGCRMLSGAALYESISPQEARGRMTGGAVIVDVREPAEYSEGHVPGARLLPLGTVSEENAAAVIPDKETEVLVYCRSGRRSKMGAEKLKDLGYANVAEFGGIIDWPYEIVRESNP